MPMRDATFMLREALEAPGAIAAHLPVAAARAAELGARLRSLDPPLIVTCGRGSSDHAATYAKYLIETRLGAPVASYAPSIASVYGAGVRLRGALFLAVSQSGRSPDLLAATEAARRAGAFTVAVVNAEASPLEHCSEAVLPIGVGPEQSVAATKSLLGAMAAIAALCAAWAGDTGLAEALEALPGDLAAAAAQDWSEAVAPLQGARGLFVLSRGLSLAGAQEAALKLKETCAIQAEAFSAAEVAHGPMALVGPGFPVLAASSFDAAEPSIAAMAQAFAERGGPVLCAGSAPAGAVRLPMAPAADPALQPLLFLQSFYILANALALARGCNPDAPAFLRKVTETL